MNSMKLHLQKLAYVVFEALANDGNQKTCASVNARNETFLVRNGWSH